MGHIFGASASPRSLTKKLAMSPSIVHGGQHDAKYVIFDLLLHAAVVADDIWGFMLEPARGNRTETRTVAFLLKTGGNGNAMLPKRFEFQRYPPRDFCTAR